jgi:hypothetical protein
LFRILFRIFGAFLRKNFLKIIFAEQHKTQIGEGERTQRKESGTFARNHGARAKAFKWLCVAFFSFIGKVVYIRLARSCARPAAYKRE